MLKHHCRRFDDPRNHTARLLKSIPRLAAKIQKLFADRGVSRGEPYLTFFEPAKLAEQVRDAGFAEVWDLGPEEANARYLANRADGLRMTADHHFMGARV